MQTRVAIAECPTYDSGNISAALGKLVQSLGGADQFIKPGSSVLIKPNLLTDRAPEKAVTTHPELVRALIRMVRQAGGTPFIGDSPAGAIKMETVLEKTGFRALCDEEKVRFVVFEKEQSVMRNYRGIPLAITKPALDADLIINAPKLKTHVFTLFTNAVKNVFGLLPGFQKSMMHMHFSNPRRFGDCLAFLYAQVNPRLTVCDAIIGMEGEGPSGGTPVQIGLLAASGDGVALDAALCRLLKINPKNVPYFENLRKMGAGETNPDNIELVGDLRAAQNLRPIRQPVGAGLMKFIPGRLARLVAPYIWIRPGFNDRCVACNRCVEVCPAKALERNANNHPRLNRGKCIGCCCCHEICPERAITMKGSPLLNMTAGHSLLSEK